MNIYKLIKPTKKTRIIFFIISDILISIFTLYFSYNLRFNFDIPRQFFNCFPVVFILLFSLKLIFAYYFKLYFVTWRLFSLQDMKKILYSHIVAYTVFISAYMFFLQPFLPMPRSAVLIDFFLSIIFIGFFRISKRLHIQNISGKGKKPALLIGAHSRILSFFNEDLPFNVEAILETDKNLISSYIGNFKILPLDELEEIISKHGIQTAVITKDYPSKFLDEIFERLNNSGVTEIKILKFLEDRVDEIKDISIEDLLARKPKDLDIETISKFIKNKTIIVTGAGGSIGSEICRQCIRFKAKNLILIDNSEFNLYKITEELQNNKNIKPVLKSVTERDDLFSIIGEKVPDIIIHAAAYKHVHLVEKNGYSAVVNNILGTKNVIDAAIANKVKKVVIISSDKAVRPSSIMGATKRVCELYAQNVHSDKTEISVVRFGNVLGSSGSVVPKFIEQINKGGPVTVTHPEVTRFFMLIPEACQLVLQAAAIAKGGEVFILDMGEPVKILNLAKKLIKLYGKEDEIKIVFTGLKPGEKLYEELLLEDKEENTTYESIYIAKPTFYNIEKLEKDIEELISKKEIVKKLKEIVPEFQQNNCQ